MSVSMDDSTAKDQSSASGRSTSKLLRYPLRSASKSKEEKPPLVDSSNTHSATRKGRVSVSTVSKSISVLDISGKDKSASAKPPRRLSVPNKSNATPAPKSVGNVTPLSEARAMRSAVNQGKCVTPVSDVSKSSSTRKKFSTLYSTSYWLSQIKHSESAAKHSISLGFFKLALEAGCEPIQRMSDELKSYVRRHDLAELGEFVKELFECYKISENFDLSHSENGSHVPSEGNQLYDDDDDDVKSSSSSVMDAGKLKPKSLDLNADETQKVNKVNSEISENDDTVKKISEKDDTVKKISEKDDTVKKISEKDDTVKKISEKDDTVKKISEKDDTVKKISEKDDTVKKISEKDDTVKKISEKDDTVKKTVRRSVPKRAASSESGSEVKGRSVQKKPQKLVKQESAAQDKDKVKKKMMKGKKSASEEGPLNSSPPEETREENKENMVASEMAEVGSTEA